MALNTNVFGADRVTSGQDNAVHTNEQNELFTAGGLPPGTDYTRQGKRYAMASIVAVAGLVVRPTTVAALEIHNLNTVKSMIVTKLWNFNLVSTAAENQWSGWVMVTLNKAAPTAEATAVVTRLNGKVSDSIVTGDFGTTVVANGWYPYHDLSTKVNTTGVLPTGAQVNDHIDGSIIVPPGSSLCLHVVGTVVGSTFTQGAEWIEEELSF